MIDYNVRVVPFPNRAVPALVTPNDDGTFDIYINGLLTEEQQKEALRHEVEHLEKDHFYKEEPVACMEAEANHAPVPPLPAPPPPGKVIPLYQSMKHLEHYLFEMGALTTPIELLNERRA